jgi:hypothetical protein
VIVGPAETFRRIVSELESCLTHEIGSSEASSGEDVIRRFRETHPEEITILDTNSICAISRRTGGRLRFDETLGCYRTSAGAIPATVRFVEDAIAVGAPANECTTHAVAQIESPHIEELAVGLESGAAAFPLKRHAVYLRSGSGHISERWLRRLSSDASAVLLIDADMVPVADDLASRFRQVKAKVVVEPNIARPGSDTRLGKELAAFRALDAVMVPTTGDHKDIEFIPGSTMPDIAADYQRFRFLWRAGFRHFALASFGGTQQIELPHLLDRFAGRHKGKRCFVVGNGPSLNQIDMSLLKDEITFGSNRCYLGFEKWGIDFNYWACVDRLQMEEYALEYADNLPREMVKFFPFEYVSLWQPANACPMNFDYEWRPPYRFSASPDVVYLGFTVTQALLQLAACMGCNPIYLIGVDHRYNLSKNGAPRTLGRLNAKIWVADDASKPTHFTNDYTSGGKPMLFVTPKPEKAEACFAEANKWALGNDVQILNATPNSALDVFPKIDFNAIFRG